MLIDRYIGRAQLHAFVVVFVSLAGLYFVFDAFTNMEEFLSHAAETGSLAKVLASYYGCRLIWFFDATSPVISLASAMFALTWLERQRAHRAARGGRAPVADRPTRPRVLGPRRPRRSHQS
jgi:lipopolysaccharide export LptBFGC system permease protein LptF